jgi:hypothetical protein
MVIKIELVSCLSPINFNDAIRSTGSYYSSLTIANAMPCLIIFTLMGLNLRIFTLNEHTSVCFLMSQSFTAPSCPQLNS